MGAWGAWGHPWQRQPCLYVVALTSATRTARVLNEECIDYIEYLQDPVSTPLLCAKPLPKRPIKTRPPALERNWLPE